MPDPFISQQDLSDLLGRDVTADNGALMAVDAACDICRNFANNPFNLGTATINLDGSGTDVLVLPNRPVNNVGTITLNGGTTLITDYFLSAQGLLIRGTADGWCGYDSYMRVWPRGRQNVKLTIESGYDLAGDGVPRDVRMVALQIAMRLVVQGVAQQETIGDATVVYSQAATDLTKGEERILNNYRIRPSF